MMRRTACLLLSGLVLWACKRDREESVELQFEPKTYTAKSSDTCSVEQYDCSIAQLEVLEVLGDSEVSEKINQTLHKHLVLAISQEEDPQVRDPQQLAEDFIAQQKEVVEKFGTDFPWRALANQSLYHQTDTLITIGVETQVLAGGAHGYGATSFFNFDPYTGRQYAQSELFAEGFTDYVEGVFRQQEEIPSEASINSTGFWFENDRFHLPVNIGFEKDQVILVYNPYEIASYADGEFYLELPLNEVLPYLKPLSK